MKQDKILQSSLLDLLFENRNKQYGAYELRKNYPRRLRKAVIGSLSVILLLFIGLSSFKSNKNERTRSTSTVDPVLLNATPEQPKEKEKPKPKTAVPKGTPANKMPKTNPNTSKIEFTTDTNIPVLNTSSFSNPKGNPDLPGNPSGPVGIPGGIGTPVKDTIEIKKDIVLKVPEIALNPIPPTDAKYPGGREAMGIYLQEKLGDEAIEDGESKKIIVTYNIEVSGEITNVAAQGNDDAEFVKKTIKVFQKMKKWIPATQNGQPVRTSHYLPVVIQPIEL
jgi:periplasmic protein TonB